MPLILTEEQTMLKEAADGFLNEHAPISHLRKLRDGRDPDGVSRDLWRAFGEMGFAGVIIPEDHGGSGLGAVEAGVMAEALGRTLTPSPFLGSGVLSAKVLVDGGSVDQQAAWLPRIAAGEAIVSLAVDEGAKHAPSRIAAVAERSGNGFRLNGAKGFVLDGHVADALIVAALTGNGLTLFLVDPTTAGVEIERTVMVDAHNAARVTLTDVEVDADAVIGSVDGGEALLEAALNLGRACAAASLNGAGDQAFQTTMEYLRTRKQFGKLIGEFQALQHRSAHLFSGDGRVDGAGCGTARRGPDRLRGQGQGRPRRRTGGAGGGADARRRRHDRRIRRRPVHEAGAGAQRTAGGRGLPSGTDGAGAGLLGSSVSRKRRRARLVGP